MESRPLIDNGIYENLSLWKTFPMGQLALRTSRSFKPCFIPERIEIFLTSISQRITGNFTYLLEEQIHFALKNKNKGSNEKFDDILKISG